MEEDIIKMVELPLTKDDVDLLERQEKEDKNCYRRAQDDKGSSLQDSGPNKEKTLS